MVLAKLTGIPISILIIVMGVIAIIYPTQEDLNPFFGRTSFRVRYFNRRYLRPHFPLCKIDGGAGAVFNSMFNEGNSFSRRKMV